MKIAGTEGMSLEDINDELQKGGRFVVYQFCVSLFLITFKRASDIYFVRSGSRNLGPSLAWSSLSFFFGWWGIPWGPVYTVSTIFTNLSGGKDVTLEVLDAVNANLALQS